MWVLGWILCVCDWFVPVLDVPLILSLACVLFLCTHHTPHNIACFFSCHSAACVCAFWFVRWTLVCLRGCAQLFWCGCIDFMFLVLIASDFDGGVAWCLVGFCLLGFARLYGLHGVWGWDIMCVRLVCERVRLYWLSWCDLSWLVFYVPGSSVCNKSSISCCLCFTLTALTLTDWNSDWLTYLPLPSSCFLLVFCWCSFHSVFCPLPLDFILFSLFVFVFWTELEQKHADPFGSLPDSHAMEDVLSMVAKAEGYTEEEMQQVLAVLQGKWVRTVHNLRGLSKERIETLGLPPLITEYLLRVKGWFGATNSLHTTPNRTYSCTYYQYHQRHTKYQRNLFPWNLGSTDCKLVNIN